MSDNRYLSMIQGQQSGVNLSDMIIKTVASEFVKSMFDTSDETGMTNEETENYNISKAELSRNIEGLTKVKDSLKATRNSFVIDVDNIKNGITKDIAKYTDENNNIDYEQMSLDVNKGLDNYYKNYNDTWSSKDDKGNQVWGTYNYDSVDRDGQIINLTGSNKLLGQFSEDSGKTLKNMIDAVKVGTSSKNTILSSQQELGNALDKLSDIDANLYQGTDTPIIDKMGKFAKSLSLGQGAGLQGLNHLKTDLESQKLLEASIQRATGFDTKDEIGIQLQPQLANLPYVFDDEEVKGFTPQQKEDYENTKGRLEIDGKSVLLKDVANEIDSLIRTNNPANLRQANFLMNRLLPGGMGAKTRDALQKQQEKDILAKQRLYYDENRGMQVDNYSVLQQDVRQMTGYSVSEEGNIISTKVIQGGDEFLLAFSDDVRKDVISGLQMLKPDKRKAQNDKSMNYMDTEFRKVSESAKLIGKMILKGRSKEQNGGFDKFTLQNADNTIRYGFDNKNGTIDIDTLQDKDKEAFIDFMMNDVVMPNSKIGLNSVEDDSYNNLYFDKKNERNSHYEYGGDNDALVGIESRALVGLTRALKLKNELMNQGYKTSERLDNVRQTRKDADEIIPDDKENGKEDGKLNETEKVLEGLKLNSQMISDNTEDYNTRARELAGIQNSIAQLEGDEPNITNLINQLTDLQKVNVSKDGYLDDGLKKALGSNVSLGINKIKNGFIEEAEMAREFYETAEASGLTNFFSNFGDSADTGYAMMKDLERKGEKSKFNEAIFTKMLSRFQSLRRENDVMVEPLKKYLYNRDTGERTVNRTSDDFRQGALGGKNMLASVQRAFEADAGQTAIGQDMQFYLTGKQRLDDDKRLLLDSLNRLDTYRQDAPNNKRTIREEFANLNKLQELKSERFKVSGSKLGKTSDDMIAVLETIRNETNLANQ